MGNSEAMRAGIKIIITYKLKPGISLGNYQRWSQEVDRKVVLAQRGIRSFELYLIKGGFAKPTFRILEIITAGRWQDWLDALKTPAMTAGHKQWKRFCDKKSLRVVYGKTF